MDDYQAFIASKHIAHKPAGFTPEKPISPILFDFQRHAVLKALELGRSAVFFECGLGKSFIQIEWAKHVSDKELKPVLIVAPLVVCGQTIREGAKLGVTIHKVKKQHEIKRPYGIYITNYERVDDFEASQFTGVVLDESSILKSTDGKTRTALIEQWSHSKYRLCCTATPAPNDVMELGNHSQFLGIMSQSEMLSMYFVHDGGETQKWRLKGHATKEFWKWVSTWAILARHPRDIGFEQEGYDLPSLTMKEIVVEATVASEGYLFALPASTLKERLGAYRDGLEERVKQVVRLCSNSEQWVIWCKLNDESELITKSIPDAVEITGSDDEEVKAQRMLDFADGKIRVLVSKPKIAGFGVNWQNCHNTAFAGVLDSFEQYHQAIRRFWRFGQAKPVNVYVIGSEAETAVFQNLKRKAREHEKMANEIINLTNNKK